MYAIFMPNSSNPQNTDMKEFPGLELKPPRWDRHFFMTPFLKAFYIEDFNRHQSMTLPSLFYD
jgi:hypothetical protein